MTIFVDMDEVIADTFGAHIEIYNTEFNGNLTPEACKGSEVWKMVPKAHQESIRKHATRRGFFKNLNPIEGSKDILKELAEKYNVYIASAAMQFPNSLEEKSEWLDEHFPFIPWQNRILCGHKHILKGDVLIDDRSYNLEMFNGRSILYSSPHNAYTNGFERADTWEEIGEKLL
ncbi:5'(3')-deoxyribonucleotidase [Maribacter polysiphoniae]|uniref:5'(3')-deoxyribonucleotidase n=1 Tax=Maribacter polysiphoniae TaxID=429344 RepID=A0A316E548_9FLAO|nr:5'(3')-deoxyribonucleotidase [Maribacter polysiphoniae]MBD1260345.1 5'(3')-deoxyribonucleotidase [Maribacter polysiphoniae]PWK25807.1 5'(3')-deoxyribonucleotidase [Maribacter polysiphoniae]